MTTRRNFPIGSVLTHLLLAIVAFSPPLHAALHLSPPRLIAPPGLTTNFLHFRQLKSIVVGAKSALLTWVEFQGVPGSATNTFAVAIGQDGNMIDPAGRLVSAEMFAYGSAQIVPVGDRFFAIYRRQTLNTAYVNSTEWFLTALDSSGSPIVSPRTLTTDPSQHIAASNGDTVLDVWWHPTDRRPAFTIFDRDANLLASGPITNAIIPYASHETRLASAAGNYLLVWQQPHIRAALIDGRTGEHTLHTIVTNQQRLMGLASNGSQYLLALQNSTEPVFDLLLLNASGEVIASGAVPYASFSPSPQILARGDEWYVFDYSDDEFRTLSSYTVRAQGGTLITSPGPLPPVEGRVVQLFGKDQFILAQSFRQHRPNVAYRIVGPSGSAPLRYPLSRVEQTHTAVATSPFGYIAAWQETGDTTNILALRFHRDGSRLDPEPIFLSRGATHDAIRINYENHHYRLVWRQSVDPAGRAVGFLIDPRGPPNLRTNFVAIQNWKNARPLDITPYRDSSLVFQAVTYETHAAIATGSARLLGNITFAGRGNDLLKVIDYSSDLTVGMATNFSTMPAQTLSLGRGSNVVAVALSNSFLIAWRDTARRLATAVYDDGRIIRTNALLPSLTNTARLALAGSRDKALLSVITTGTNLLSTNTFFLIDESSLRASSTSHTMIRTNSAISLAALGRDFLVADSQWDGFGLVATLQVLSETPPPALASPALEAGDVIIPLANLDSTRTYRIERSADTVLWEEGETFTGAEALSIVADTRDAQYFYRAVLIPE